MAEKRASRASLAPAVRQDFRVVLQWSDERNFGEATAARYKALIQQAVRDIGADPERAGSKERPELMTRGARTYRLEFSRSRVSGSRVKELRHFLLYRRRDDTLIEVGRFLHDSRDLRRQLPEEYRRGAHPPEDDS